LYFFKPFPQAPNRPYQIWSQGESENNRHWIPCYDKPDDRLTTEIIVYSPKGFQVISNGNLVEKKVVQHLPFGISRKKAFPQAKGWLKWHFLQSKPHVTYLISLIIGKFAKKEDLYIKGKRKIPLAYYVPPDWEQWAHFSFENTKKMIGFFESFTKTPYPWPKYDQTTVWDFIYGGMENTGATTLNMYTLHRKEAHKDHKSDYLVAHELAHQWFGDYITCKDWSHIWLNEGFATYFTYLWAEYYEGKSRFFYSMEQNNRGYISTTTHEKWKSFQLKKNTPIDLAFSNRAYTRGAAILHMLRFVLGDKGFQKAIQEHCRRNRLASVTSEDFRAACEEATGKDLSWFFQQWVYGAGYPEFKVRYHWNEETSQAVLTVEQVHAFTPARNLFITPMLIELIGPNYRIKRRIWIFQKKQTFTYSLPGPPQIVDFNRHGWILCKVDFPKVFSLLQNQLLYDPDSLGRWRAARDLGDFGDKNLPLFQKAFAKEKMDFVRREILSQVLKGLTQKKMPLAQVFPFLLQALKDKDNRVKESAIMGLSYFPHQKKKVISILEKILQTSQNGDILAKAAYTLAKVEGKKAFPLLVELLKRYSHREVIKSSIFRAFQEWKDPRAIPIL
ncbi:MAG: hypothetical protein D6785_08365, partial [Planctomycetota bacterium]